MRNNSFEPNKIFSYFKTEWIVLLAVAVSGLIYNLGLLAGPWFEGKMTGCLIDILNGTQKFNNMLVLVICYIVSTILIQAARYIKRFYVRRFSNNVNQKMKRILYSNLIQKSKSELEEEGMGNVMTKAISDVDDCAEGMRKFTTEIFDTGIALMAYAGMLLWYDWQLALICMIFPPISYILAEKMKTVIQSTGTMYKKQAGILSAATLDRASNAVTYRVFGCEKQREASYEKNLSDYEYAAIKANIWNTILPPVYRIISMTGVLFILYFGAKNVMGTGWKNWDIAIFTTFLSCFTKLSVKSSNAAKLFNSVHKAQVSWKRIKPLMNLTPKKKIAEKQKPAELIVKNLSFSYPDGKMIFENLSFTAKPGQIIGITGPVACGKSTLGKTFLCEYPYKGSITFSDKELQNTDSVLRTEIIGYLGHNLELFNDSIKNNILLGNTENADTFLKLVCLDQEVYSMSEGINTIVGNGGVRLSGGQAQRLALARTLCHMKPILILDDPFSAVDKNTEKQIFTNLKNLASDSIVLLISHRLYLFPQMDKIIWMNKGHTSVATHDVLMNSFPEYAQLYHTQKGEINDEL